MNSARIVEQPIDLPSQRINYPKTSVASTPGAWRGLISKLHRKGVLSSPLPVKEETPWDYKPK
jgi:hypothetical protein